RSIAPPSRGSEAAVLVWDKRTKLVIWTLTAIIVGIFYVAPFAVIAMASFAGQWNGLLPSALTFEHYADAISGDSGEELRVSLMTGVAASAISLFIGTWAALALRGIAAP